jgi:hypothetical protein
MGSVRSLDWRKNEDWAFFSSTRHFNFFCKKARGKYVRKICEKVCLYYSSGRIRALVSVICEVSGCGHAMWLVTVINSD